MVFSVLIRFPPSDPPNASTDQVFQQAQDEAHFHGF